MGPGVGVHPAARRLLDPVVADGRGGVERVGDLLARHGLEERLAVLVLDRRRGAHPGAGVAVGLHLEADRVGAGARLAAVGAVERAAELLHVVAPLVPDDVHLGEGPGRGAELLAQLVEEVGVDVERSVGRAVEGPGRAGRAAAAGVDGGGEEEELGARVALDAHLGGGGGPVGVERVGGPRHAAVDARVRVGARGAALERFALDLLRLPGRPAHRRRGRRGRRR